MFDCCRRTRQLTIPAQLLDQSNVFRFVFFFWHSQSASRIEGTQPINDSFLLMEIAGRFYSIVRLRVASHFLTSELVCLGIYNSSARQAAALHFQYRTGPSFSTAGETGVESEVMKFLIVWE